VGRAKLVAFSVTVLIPSLQLCSGLYTQQPWGHSSLEINSLAATGRGRLGPKAPPPSETCHYWNRQAATRKKPIRQACLFFWPDNRLSAGLSRTIRDTVGQRAVCGGNFRLAKEEAGEKSQRPEESVALTSG